MADQIVEAPAGGTPPEVPAANPVAPITPPSEEEPFDKDRALTTIRKLREFEKTAKASLKELADLKAAQTQAETDKLKAAGEYKTLLDASEAKVKELEPVTTERDRYKGVVESLLQVERKGLPKHITALLDKLDVADQLAWIAENKETISQPKAPNVNATDGRAGGQVAASEYGGMSKDELAARYGVKPQFLK